MNLFHCQRLFASLKPMERNTWNPKAETHPGDWLRLCCSRNSSDGKTLVKLARRATCHPIIYPLLSFNTIILSLWSHESLPDAQKSTPLSGMILRKVPLSGTVWFLLECTVLQEKKFDICIRLIARIESRFQFYVLGGNIVHRSV